MKRLVILQSAALILMWVMVANALDVSKFLVSLNTSKGTMSFLEKGWFKNEEYPIRFFGGYWHYQTKDGNWHELLAPYITSWNKYYFLILDRGGRIFVSKKDNSSRYEIRLIGGTWCDNAGGEWNPIEY